MRGYFKGERESSLELLGVWESLRGIVILLSWLEDGGGDEEMYSVNY